MRSGGRRGAGERVLESKHVIGLFLLMLVFSGVFFTLGYVMGRNQYDGQVQAQAAINGKAKPPTTPLPKADVTPHTKRSSSTPADAEPPSDLTAQPNSEWSFYNAGKSAGPDDNLKPAASSSPSRTLPAVAKSRNGKSQNGALAQGGNYILQVAALRKGSDALALAAHLQKKRFPAYVTSLGPDKYYRVQVGPYADQKSAEAARKDLEGAGFKAIVKR